MTRSVPQVVFVEPDSSDPQPWNSLRCGRFNCLDKDNHCKHCGAHDADPHEPDCKHADEPFDECDARPADPEDREEVTEETTGR
ncbi:hypothetical protein ACQEVC_34235 [Plantactinospora sp. CA-294935]|uniref:hypothetical protein n=1 Tax=Plantactinospora sp. CA-294935 TaxID=3240012 RepID=UPI003D89DF73